MMKQNIIRGILLICIVCPVFSFGQMNVNTNLPNVLPSNPKAYEFMKYGEIPVSKYTGVPNISIPIYTIEAKGLSIPITLTYHSAGFKVNEEAGWTGLGWTLNGGGSITQIVQGTDDFGYYKFRILPDFQEIEPDLRDEEFENCDGFYIQGTTTEQSLGDVGCSPWNFFMPYYASGEKDAEPDIFSFNFLDYSGKFVLDWEEEVFVCLSDPNLKIEAVNYNYPSSALNYRKFVTCGKQKE